MIKNYICRTTVFFVTIAISLIAGATAHARPYRGGIPWSFILCKYTDSPTPSNDVTYYRNMTMTPGTKGLDDYVKSISNGLADMSGSVMHGWYTVPNTYESSATRKCKNWCAMETTGRRPWSRTVPRKSFISMR